MTHRGEERRLGGAGFSRFVACRLKLRLNPFSLGDVLIGAVKIFQHFLGAEHLALQQESADIPVGCDDPMVQLDPDALEGLAESPDQRQTLGRKFSGLRQGDKPAAYIAAGAATPNS